MKAVGIDGRAMNMATAAFTLDVLGAEGEETSLKSEYKGQCCVGDLPAFASLGAETSACMSVGLGAFYTKVFHPSPGFNT
jgi:hypothetical protein|tara:strand:- start:156 stop:395 length:240 start_codon:yes stop_codon:yes gene_type:complete